MKPLRKSTISGFGETKCRKKGKKATAAQKKKAIAAKKMAAAPKKKEKKAAAAKKTAAAAKKKRKNGKRGRGKKQRFIFVSFGISGTLRCLLEFIGVFSNTTSCIFE